MCKPQVTHASLQITLHSVKEQKLNLTPEEENLKTLWWEKSLKWMEISLLLDVKDRVKTFPLGGCDLVFPSLSWSLLCFTQSLYCSWVTQPCHHKPAAISAATSLLFSLSSSCRCYPSVISWYRAHIDSNDEILKSGLSSPFTVLSLLDLNAKNGSEANLWLRWLWPLICDPLCLCLWNMPCFLHLICRQMDNMVWRGLFRRLLFPAQSMMECNYQECRMKPWGQRPFPPCYE